MRLRLLFIVFFVRVFVDVQFFYAFYRGVVRTQENDGNRECNKLSG